MVRPDVHPRGRLQTCLRAEHTREPLAGAEARSEPSGRRAASAGSTPAPSSAAPLRRGARDGARGAARLPAGRTHAPLRSSPPFPSPPRAGGSLGRRDRCSREAARHPSSLPPARLPKPGPQAAARLTSSRQDGGRPVPSRVRGDAAQAAELLPQQSMRRAPAPRCRGAPAQRRPRRGCPAGAAVVELASPAAAAGVCSHRQGSGVKGETGHKAARQAARFK